MHAELYMIRIKQAIITEGRYDKIRLSNIVDAVIICTNGFSVFKDKEKQELIKSLAAKTGVIILTDSDSAGFKIRSFIRGFVKNGEVLNAVTPDIYGKERRKLQPSKQGKLGVEGIPDELLIEALKNAGATELDGTPQAENPDPVTRSDLMDLGLIGGEGSSDRRRALQRRLGLPELLSAKLLLDVVNKMYSRSEFISLAKDTE
ncbi:MAG: toprim domain-containing protein [Oscillospiraceae bacterium]